MPPRYGRPAARAGIRERVDDYGRHKAFGVTQRQMAGDVWSGSTVRNGGSRVRQIRSPAHNAGERLPWADLAGCRSPGWARAMVRPFALSGHRLDQTVRVGM